MKELIILQGLPASGKSTWAKKWVLENPTKRVRVNRDDIRRMLGPYWVPTREDLVTDIEHRCIKAALLEDYSVVLDATNFKATEHGWTMILREAGIIMVKITIHKMDTSIEMCLARDKFRPEAERVGEKVIKNMAKKYLNYKEEDE